MERDSPGTATAAAGSPRSPAWMAATSARLAWPSAAANAAWFNSVVLWVLGTEDRSLVQQAAAGSPRNSAGPSSLQPPVGHHRPHEVCTTPPEFARVGRTRPDVYYTPVFARVGRARPTRRGRNAS